MIKSLVVGVLCALAFVAGLVVGQTHAEHTRPVLGHTCALVGNAACFCEQAERMEIRKNVMLCWSR